MSLAGVPTTVVGGVKVASLTLMETAQLMIDVASRPRRPDGPFYFTSANGEVLARRFLDCAFAKLVATADLISVDGQPLVIASRLFSRRRRLPERVATTDLYPIVARMAQDAGISFYLLGASDEINRRAYDETQRIAPRINIIGRSHGYLEGAQLESKLDEINELAPDILWLAMGVPLEQVFVRDYAHRLKNVKIIKTAGGLFDFVSGAKRRAPQWMQDVGLEWAFRLGLEPKRLTKRYLLTNPLAALLVLILTD